MFDAKAFAAMRPTAYFVNVGRGRRSTRRRLIDAMRVGTIAGAALDVFVEEPLPDDSPLWSMPTSRGLARTSPATCSGGRRRWSAVFVDNLRRFVAGEPLRNQVDTEAGFGVG